jgi:hypothetical protein
LAENKVFVGQVCSIPRSNREIYTNYQKTIDFLERLKATQNKFDAIDLIVTETPDGTMALNTYVNYTMQGGHFEFYNARTGKFTKKYDAEFRDWCARAGKANASGLDGINRELAISAYTHGGMAIEILVKDDLSDIDDILIVDPKTFRKYEWIDDEKRYAIYQQREDGKEIDLYTGNFYWIPFQPKIGTPEGTLKFASSIMMSTMYWQMMADFGEYLNRIAIPRYKASIDTEAIAATATAQQKADPKEMEKLFQTYFVQVESQLRKIGKNSDIITSKTNDVSVLGGGNVGNGFDIRALSEALDPEMCAAFQLPLVLLNRQKSGSYALGTAEMKSFTDTIDSQRKAIKRLNEEIANFWARVHGYNIKAKYVPNELDWEIQKEKWEANLKKLEFARRSEEYGYYDAPQASLLVGGSENPSKDTKGMYEYLKQNWKNGGGTVIEQNNQ